MEFIRIWTTTKKQPSLLKERREYWTVREALFIFWALATLSVLRCHLTFALESLTFLTIATFRTFCHLSVIFVIYSDLKIVSQQKNGINLWKFSCDDLLRLLKRWYNEFNRRRHSLTDEFRKGRPKSVVGPENINAVQKMIMQDRHVTYCEIEATLGSSSISIYKILLEHLTMKKICSRWILHNLQKLKKMQESISANKCSRNTMPMLQKTCIRL